MLSESQVGARVNSFDMPWPFSVCTMAGQKCGLQGQYGVIESQCLRADEL